MNINEIIQKIIPPDNYQNRYDFDNRSIIDSLSYEEQKQVEELLIKLLMTKSDLLIVETLSYLKSEKSLPIFYSLLNSDCNEWAKIIISASIYSIKKDNMMIDVAINAFKKFEQNQDNYFKFTVLPMFYYLARFRNERINDILEKYSKDSDYLIAYNANKALNNSTS